jgi:hypothetical protein
MTPCKDLTLIISKTADVHTVLSLVNMGIYN